MIDSKVDPPVIDGEHVQSEINNVSGIEADVDVLLGILDPHIQDLGTAYRQMQLLIRETLDKDSVESWALRSTDSDNGSDAEIGVSRESRRQLNKELQLRSDELFFYILRGRHVAQNKFHFETQDEPEEEHVKFHKYEQDSWQTYRETIDSDDPYVQHKAKVWKAAHDIQEQICIHENELKQSIRNFFALNNLHAIHLISKLNGTKLSQTEYQPLLVFLAKDYTQDKNNSILLSALVEIRNNLDLFVPNFCKDLDTYIECFDEPEDTAKEESKLEIFDWLRFISLLGKKDEHVLLPSNFLPQQPIKLWPTELRAMLNDYADKTMNHYIEVFIKLIEDYQRASLVNVSDEDIIRWAERVHSKLSSVGNTAKRRKKRPLSNGRTSKAAIDVNAANKETLVGTKVFAIGVCSQIQNVYHTEQSSLNSEDPLELAAYFMDIKIVKNFLEKYKTDASLKDDLERMVTSIVMEPRGNGCKPLTQTRTSVENELGVHLTGQKIWHFNPNKRRGLAVGHIGSATRIDYILLPDNNGKEVLYLLSIYNKNAAARGRL